MHLDCDASGMIMNNRYLNLHFLLLILLFNPKDVIEIIIDNYFYIDGILHAQFDKYVVYVFIDDALVLLILAMT